MKSLLNKCKKYFKANGLRFTPQREELLKTIFTVSTHFDVDFLHSQLKEKGVKVSKATIYRAIPLMKDCGVINDVTRIDNKDYYEFAYNRQHHDHMICTNCGSIIEFHNEKIEELQHYICDEHNFFPETHQLIIRGLCEKCRSKQ